jgi:hypothetical protein
MWNIPEVKGSFHVKWYADSTASDRPVPNDVTGPFHGKWLAYSTPMETAKAVSGILGLFPPPISERVHACLEVSHAQNS